MTYILKTILAYLLTDTVNWQVWRNKEIRRNIY